MAPALALMPLGGRRPAQRTGTDRNDAPARDTYAKAPDPSPGHLCSIEMPGTPMRVLSAPAFAGTLVSVEEPVHNINCGPIRHGPIRPLFEDREMG